MVDIMETLDSIDGNKKSSSGSSSSSGSVDGIVSYDEAGNPEEPLPSAEERAKDLFEALDKDGDGVITMEDFVNGWETRQGSIIN